jgi:hypothetical protein
MDSFIGTIKSLQMVHREKFSQPKYDIKFQIAKTYTMSEIDSRKTNTNSSCTGVYRDHKYFKGKKLSINAHYRLPVSPLTSPLACDTICQTEASPFDAPARKITRCIPFTLSLSLAHCHV